MIMRTMLNLLLVSFSVFVYRRLFLQEIFEKVIGGMLPANIK